MPLVCCRHHPSIWDHVLHSERHRTFESLDKVYKDKHFVLGSLDLIQGTWQPPLLNMGTLQDKDGFLSAEDLHSALGRSENVKQLIAAADANGDGGPHDHKSFEQLFFRMF